MKILEIHKKTKQDEPFYIVDKNVLLCQHMKWKEQLPYITPFYAVKSNHDPVILQALVDLGIGFACNSMHEIETILSYEVPVERIIFANPCKANSQIKLAKHNKVPKMTFDNFDELIKIKELYPDAELFVRISVDESPLSTPFGSKFGVRLEDTRTLLTEALNLNLNVIGISFDVGTANPDPSLFVEAIRRSRVVYDIGRELGYNFTLLDIGGGFTGTDGEAYAFEDYVKAIDKAMELYISDIKEGLSLLAEPGCFYVTSSVTIVTNVIGKKSQDESQDNRFIYFLNDEIQGSFKLTNLSNTAFSPKFVKNGHLLLEVKEEELYDSSIWGSSVNERDCLIDPIRMPELKVGDWIIFENMGSHTCVVSPTLWNERGIQTYYIDSN